MYDLKQAAQLLFASVSPSVNEGNSTYQIGLQVNIHEALGRVLGT